MDCWTTADNSTPPVADHDQSPLGLELFRKEQTHREGLSVNTKGVSILPWHVLKQKWVTKSQSLSTQGRKGDTSWKTGAEM